VLVSGQLVSEMTCYVSSGTNSTQRVITRPTVISHRETVTSCVDGWCAGKAACVCMCVRVYLWVYLCVLCMRVCVSTVHEEPVLATVHQRTVPVVSELFDSTFSILDADSHQHRLLTVTHLGSNVSPLKPGFHSNAIACVACVA